MLFEPPPAAQERQSVARRLAETRIAPRAAEVDRAETYPWDNVAALRTAGLFGYTFPQQYGGSGGSFLDAVVITEQTPVRLPPTYDPCGRRNGYYLSSVEGWGKV
jgi:alkylation response protein AidB-like acyl-CoA dehydrogenase